jgi:hypothetical protein
MEWSVKESHVAVIALHNCGKCYSQIFELLKPLEISQMFIYWSIKPCEEIWRVEDRTQAGRLKILRAQAAIETVRERIRRNPLWKEIMSRELNISTQSMSRLIRDDLHMRAHRCSKRHVLTPALRAIRRTRAERLLQWHAENGHENILFTDEKIFTIEEQYNNQQQDLCSNVP